MDLDSLVSTPSEETVQEYVNVIQNTDLKTGLIALGLLIIGLLAVKLILRAVNQGLQRSRIPRTLHTMIRTLLRILLVFVVFLTVANYLDLPITPFITLLGLVGLALSLALQGMLSNLAGGFLILASHPFEVGHYIEQDGISGTVQEIRLQHTRLETPDGKIIYIPNSSISSSRVINYTETGKRRVEINVSASYDNSPAQVRAAVMAAAQKVEGILSEPAPILFVDNYGDSAIEYVIQAWVSNPDFITVKRGLMEELYSTFQQTQVEMTYPHMNVHISE